MATKFVELLCKKGNETFRYLVQTESIAFAAAYVFRRDAEMYVQDATVIELDGIVLTQPQTFNEETEDASTEATSEDDTEATTDDQPETTEDRAEKPEYFDEGFFEDSGSQQQ